MTGLIRQCLSKAQQLLIHRNWPLQVIIFETFYYICLTVTRCNDLVARQLDTRQFDGSVVLSIGKGCEEAVICTVHLAISSSTPSKHR